MYEKLMKIRSTILRYYTERQTVINPILRFFLCFVTFLVINKNIGANHMLTNIVVVLILSLMGTFLPQVVLILLATMVSILHVASASVILAGIVILIFFILYCFIARFSGKYAYAVLAVPILYTLNLQYIVPMLLGVIAGPMAVFPVTCGVAVYYIFGVIKGAMLDISAVSSIDATLELYQSVVSEVLFNKAMYADMIVFAAVLIIVYLIKRLSINYSYEIGIAVGGLAGMIMSIVLNIMLDMNQGIVKIIFGTILAMLIVYVCQFFFLILDYQAIEYMQFEDDDYYYYVKAVPKVGDVFSAKGDDEEETAAKEAELDEASEEFEKNAEKQDE